MLRLTALTLALGVGLAGPALAQRALDARETRALNCAAMFHLGTSQLEKTGRISARDRDQVQAVAQEILKQVPGNRRSRTQLMNQRIQQLASGKTTRQLVLEYDKIDEKCIAEFLN